MMIELIVVGKSESQGVELLMDNYLERLSDYARVVVSSIPTPNAHRRVVATSQRRDEGEMVVRLLRAEDHLVLIDRGGKAVSSMEFAQWLRVIGQGAGRDGALGEGEGEVSYSVEPTQYDRLVFVIGGDYGFSPELLARANDRLSLSTVAVSPQLERIILLEQLYRAFTIITNTPYHYEWSQ